MSVTEMMQIKIKTVIGSQARLNRNGSCFSQNVTTVSVILSLYSICHQPQKMSAKYC